MDAVSSLLFLNKKEIRETYKIQKIEKKKKRDLFMYLTFMFCILILVHSPNYSFLINCKHEICLLFILSEKNIASDLN